MIVMVVLAVPTGLLVLDAAWTAATNPQRQTQVIEVSAGVRDAPTHDRATATVFLNGLGLDIARHQAEALTPSAGRFGRVLALEYAAVFDPNEAADALHRALRPTPDTPTPTRLTVVASSMGDIRGLEIIASLGERYPDVIVDGFIVNTGPGPRKSSRVQGGDAVRGLLGYGCTPLVPGQVTLGLLEVANQALQGADVTDPARLRATFESGTSYRGRVVMNQLCSLTRPSSVERPPWVPFTAYLMPDPATADVVIDAEGAYADWRLVLPGMEVRRIRGVTHDNLSYRPDLFNPLFAEDLLPAVRQTVAARENRRPPAGGPGASRPV